MEDNDINDYTKMPLFIFFYFFIITPLNKAPKRYCALQILIYTSCNSAVAQDCATS